MPSEPPVAPTQPVRRDSAHSRFWRFCSGSAPVSSECEPSSVSGKRRRLHRNADQAFMPGLACARGELLIERLGHVGGKSHIHRGRQVGEQVQRGVLVEPGAGNHHGNARVLVGRIEIGGIERVGRAGRPRRWAGSGRENRGAGSCSAASGGGMTATDFYRRLWGCRRRAGRARNGWCRRDRRHRDGREQPEQQPGS